MTSLNPTSASAGRLPKFSRCIAAWPGGEAKGLVIDVLKKVHRHA
jgi:hypothetical protein